MHNIFGSIFFACNFAMSIMTSSNTGTILFRVRFCFSDDFVTRTTLLRFRFSLRFCHAKEFSCVGFSVRSCNAKIFNSLLLCILFSVLFSWRTIFYKFNYANDFVSERFCYAYDFRNDFGMSSIMGTFL